MMGYYVCMYDFRNRRLYPYLIINTSCFIGITLFNDKRFYNVVLCNNDISNRITNSFICLYEEYLYNFYILFTFQHLLGYEQVILHHLKLFFFRVLS